MSRSRKKTPVVKNITSGSKGRANRAVRRFNYEMQDGKWYRKIYPSWDVYDMRYYHSKVDDDLFKDFGLHKIYGK